MKRSQAEIIREYGPFPGVKDVGGITYDGRNVWFAGGATLNALDPESGETVRKIDVAADAGTAFDGEFLWQIAEARIQKIDPKSGRVVATIPAPGGGGDSGLAWGEGTLWVGQYRERKIHQIDPETGKILRTIESKRFVTGVSWVDGELWDDAAPQKRPLFGIEKASHLGMDAIGADEPVAGRFEAFARAAIQKGGELALPLFEIDEAPVGMEP